MKWDLSFYVISSLGRRTNLGHDDSVIYVLLRHRVIQNHLDWNNSLNEFKTHMQLSIVLENGPLTAFNPLIAFLAIVSRTFVL